MQSIYSKKLIKECQDVIGERAGRKISKEEAKMMLDSLAKVGHIIIAMEEAARMMEKKKSSKK